MSVWTGPGWMRPGSRFARVMWLVSLPVAVFLIWFGWTVVGTGGTAGGVAFLVVWTAGIIGIEIWNFRTAYLAHGRAAETPRRASNEDDACPAS